jgi:hypothetical protein
MNRRPSPRRAHALALTLALAALAAAPGCGTEEIKLAQVPADATEKVVRGQTKPVRKAALLPPEREQSKGRPY